MDWRTSSYSGASGGQCVEVALADGVPVTAPLPTRLAAVRDAGPQCPPDSLRLPALWYRLDNGLVIEVEPTRFEEMVAASLDGLPEELGRLMSNVAVTVEHAAGPPGLLGLYQGVPLTSRTTGYAGVLPDRITIYRQAICATCQTEQEVADQVRRTVIHEIAHHFGIDDRRLSELGW
jgi:predicted Zn-dependent protease with MMP-like domain